ncbi:MAG TPA: serine/threonine-protein kinase, partial [Gemmataceae bacterium]
MAHPQPTDRQTFLDNIRQSGLVEAGLLAAAVDRLPEGAKSKHLARLLVKEGLLTRFQAERLLIGRTSGFFLNQYRILDQLGRGGMGRVYRAEHRTMNRIVALKILAPNLLQTDRAQALFRREVRAVARLVHPNIVSAFDANHVGDRYYLVLEYVNGPNLEQLVRKQGPLPVGQACEFVRQIAHGLQYAHEMGMVHRDIKPANVLVQEGGEGRVGQGVVKISDFGLARLQEVNTPTDEGMGTILTKENTVMGTPDFLSPEQARNLHKTDIRSDLYSLGCTFYFLLTGKVPFPGGNTMEKLIRHSTEAAVPIDALRADLPAGVVAIVNRLLQKQPEARFQTPAELAGALAPFATSDSSAWKTARP